MDDVVFAVVFGCVTASSAEDGEKLVGKRARRLDGPPIPMAWGRLVAITTDSFWFEDSERTIRRALSGQQGREVMVEARHLEAEVGGMTPPRWVVVIELLDDACP